MSEYQVKVNQAKIDAVEEIKGKLEQVPDFIFTDYRGLTVGQITALRRQLRNKKADYHVVKNNYARIAFQQLGKSDVADYLVGPTAVAMVPEDSGAVVKMLLDLTKEMPLQVKGALIGDQVFDAKQAEAYSKLPTRLELSASLMGTMNAPLQNFVYATNAVTTKLVRTLQAVADKKSAA